VIDRRRINMRRNPRAACKINPEGHPHNGEKLRKKTRSGKEASYLTKKEKEERQRDQLPNHEFKGAREATCGETFGLPTTKGKRERSSKLADYSNKF
jgi:hypothetical protein